MNHALLLSSWTYLYTLFPHSASKNDLEQDNICKNQIQQNDASGSANLLAKALVLSVQEESGKSTKLLSQTTQVSRGRVMAGKEFI